MLTACIAKRLGQASCWCGPPEVSFIGKQHGGKHAASDQQSSAADAVERYMPEALRMAIEDLQDMSGKYHRQEAVSGPFNHLPAKLLHA